MPRIGEVIQQADLRSLKKWTESGMPRTVFFAPTVYKNAASDIKVFPYYNDILAAKQFYDFTYDKPGVTAPKTSGKITFAATPKAETLGINVDFLMYVPTYGWMIVPYEAIRALYIASVGKYFKYIIRFYKNDGTKQAYYTVADNVNFSISATTMDNVAPEKRAVLDEFYREISVLKYKYNALASYLNILSKKKLNPAQQQKFNEGILLLGNFREQIKAIKGLDIKFSDQGQISGIGILPLVAYYIIGAVISIAVVSWSITEIVKSKEATKKLNATYDIQKWTSEYDLEVDKAVTAGKITAAQGEELKRKSAETREAAQKNAENVLKPESGILDKATNMLLIGGGIYVLSKMM